MIKAMTNTARWLLLVSITIGASNLGATAGESVDEIKSVEPNGRVLIDNTRGRVKVYGWDRSEIHVKGELDDRTEKFIFEVRGHMTEIRVRIPQHTHFGDGSMLDIYVPRDSRVSFKGVSSDVDLVDLRAGVQVNTVSGDVEMDKVDSRVQVNTVSGDVSLVEGKGEVKMIAVSGSLFLDYDAVKLNAQTVSGDIEVRLQSFESLRAQAISGDIEITGSLMDSGDVNIETVSGEIELSLQKELNARITVETGPGGDISNDLTTDDPEDVFPSQMRLDTTAGDGSGRIRIDTVTGDVRLKD